MTKPTLTEAREVLNELAARGEEQVDDQLADAIEVVLVALADAERDLVLYRARVTAGGPPPGYHLPGKWQAPEHTPPPESATTGPATPERITL